MLLKSAQDGGIVSWGNSKQTSGSFATGSFTQNDRSTLRIYNYDTGYKDTNPTLVGWSEAPSQFNSLSWDNFGMTDNYPMGVVAGGMNDGSCIFWNVSDLIEQSQSSDYNQDDINYHGCISVIDNLFDGPITTMEFNPFKPNLLAVGGQDVLVMNIEKDIVQPQIFSPGSPNLHGDHGITSVSWNRKVQHILASASQDGLTVVWDLKINKSIFSFQDSSAILNRKVSLSWNPEIPTQIAVTYDDERVPELQIWDLRNPQGPVVVFNQAHQSGINCLSWCPSDQSLILTAGRDRQVICWNYKTQQIVRQEQFDFDIVDLKWSNKVSGVYACTGQDSHTDIRSLEGTAEGYAPKWFKPPVGANFGPTGNLITFREDQGSLLTHYSNNLKDKVVDQDLDSFDKFIELSQSGNLERINYEFQRYSEQLSSRDAMSQPAKDEFDFEMEQWKLIKALSQDDLSEYLNTLGFSRREITTSTENYTGKRHTKKTDENQQNQQNTKAQKNTYDFASLSTQDAENFFDQLTTQSIQKEQKKEQGNQKANLDQGKEVYVMEQISKNINWDTGVEKIIKDNLIIGNYDGAIDCALKSGRSAEALLLAYSQGRETFESTMSSYLTSQTDLFLKNVIRNIVGKQHEEIAKTYELTNWRECVAIILSSGELKEHSQRFSKIMIQLGDRFLNEKKDEKNALLCFILSENVERCMASYLKQLEQINPRSPAYKTKLVKVLKICIELRDMPESNGNGVPFKEGLDYLALNLSYKALAQQRSLTAYHALSQAGGISLKTNKIKDLLYNGPYQNEIRKFYEDGPPNPYKRETCNTQRINLDVHPNQQTRSQASVKKSNPIFDTPTHNDQKQNPPHSRQGPGSFVPQQTTVTPPNRAIQPPAQIQRQIPPVPQKIVPPTPQQNQRQSQIQSSPTLNQPFPGSPNTPNQGSTGDQQFQPNQPQQKKPPVQGFPNQGGSSQGSLQGFPNHPQPGFPQPPQQGFPQQGGQTQVQQPQTIPQPGLSKQSSTSSIQQRPNQQRPGPPPPPPRPTPQAVQQSRPPFQQHQSTPQQYGAQPPPTQVIPGYNQQGSQKPQLLPPPMSRKQ